jgi:hypothetical protein
MRMIKPFAFEAAEVVGGLAAGVGPVEQGAYDIAVWQAEFSLTQVLDRPISGRVFFEQVIRDCHHERTDPRDHSHLPDGHV